ncbi:aspartate/glutamate racemase family protein [Variovorax saccharolyticus]|uniref:aspartate/glutamate racemase family protein n=1 Tax=Variovorax saccharolyticus TaxID=3053516 RepID=UPI002574A61B|nr:MULTISPECIES: aspartate/glutamate racemase family protein [unclassified Variovorax]MDM0021565.1 aspartate/glutamate racemase family protein [Variovorax sp. J22R187]MDM0028178.1 aspartate/glutamate racemase family protein [Variovorax sp. J31P216]
MAARLLVVNPNTSSSVSGLLQQHLQRQLAGALEVHTVTARFGAPYIASEATYAVAQHAVLDAWATAHAHGERPDAVLIGCFGDPGLFALRDGAGVPVGGLAEAAFAAAARHGRFAIVTGGERWRPMLERLASSLGFSAALAGIHTVAPSGAQLAQDPVGARGLLAEACREAAVRFQAQAVILGGAALAGMAIDIAASVPVPLIDSVSAGGEWALAAIRSGLSAAAAPGFGVAWQSVSWELESLG